MSLPSLCLIEVASLLYLSSHLVLSLSFCPWFRESVSSLRSPVLTACLLHRYLKPSQSLSLWGPLSFPGWRPLGLSLRARAVCSLAVRLCHHRLFGYFLGSLSRSRLCPIFSGLPVLLNLSPLLSHPGIFLPPSFYVSPSQLDPPPPVFIRTSFFPLSVSLCRSGYSQFVVVLLFLPF